MNQAPDIVAALELPETAKLERRIPKTLLIENGVTTSGDRRLVQDSLDSLTWTHSLKAKNTGLAPFKDERIDYSEIAVLRAIARSRQKCGRLVEIIHRSIPYPVVLVLEDQRSAQLSLAPKRASATQAGQFVIEDRVESTGFIDAAPTQEAFQQLLRNLSYRSQPAKDLKTAYFAWLHCILSYRAAEATGRYLPSKNSAAAIREVLDARRSIERELATLRAQAKKATQLSQQVQLNLQIKDLEKTLESLTARL